MDYKSIKKQIKAIDTALATKNLLSVEFRDQLKRTRTELERLIKFF